MILVRHGRTTANASGVLAGRTAGVRLDDVGAGQAERTAERLSVVPLSAVVTSPLERCRQTARAILKAQPGTPTQATERGITECDYGDWQGRPPTGRRFEDVDEIYIFRIEDGKLAPAVVAVEDNLSRRRQLGID